MPDARSATENSAVSFWTRTILYVGTWAAALLTIDLRLWPMVYLFPAGLFAFLPPGEPDEKWATPLLCLGWLVYIVQAIFFFRANRRRIFWVWYAVLLLLLICNVGGCHQMLRGTPYGH
ncbi:MAG: hypothetical protein DMF06_00855 [Verrucomicrobia bacterium]|nr:MAG: hypothetical protein DMF06_00855 [Verrucomicrobiota bacterium]